MLGLVVDQWSGGEGGEETSKTSHFGAIILNGLAIMVCMDKKKRFYKMKICPTAPLDIQ